MDPTINTFTATSFITKPYWGPSASCLDPFAFAVTAASIPSFVIVATRPFLMLLHITLTPFTAIAVHPCLIVVDQLPQAIALLRQELLAIMGHLREHQLVD